MKTLCLATLLLVGYSSLAQIKSFDDLRGIDSEEAFIRVCLENGYEFNYDYGSKYPKYMSDVSLKYNYVKDDAIYVHKDTIVYYEETTVLGYTQKAYTNELNKGEWYLYEYDLNTKRKNGNSYYDKILAEVKSECTLFENDFNTLTYECPEEGYFTDGVKFKGKLEFSITDNTGYILHLLPDTGQ